MITSLPLPSDENLFIVLIVLIIMFVVASFTAGFFIKKKYQKMKTAVQSHGHSLSSFGQMNVNENDQDSLMEDETSNSIMSRSTKGKAQ